MGILIEDTASYTKLNREKIEFLEKSLNVNGLKNNI